ncbi:DExH-box splicing factor binding site-domain-containing protein [Xylaria nigripes]|nr:DExH-box splicing factor binding site-domain-containing protein [Xylaria nigripes]
MPDTAPQSQAPRIAIKFGASAKPKPSPSTGRNRPSQSQPSSALGKRQRPNALHGSESDDDDDATGKHEVVTTIGADTVTSRGSDMSAASRSSKEYVISSQKNRDWKADLKTRRQNKANLPCSTSLIEQDTETALADQDNDIKWGLNITKKSPREGSSSPIREVENHKPSASDATTLISQTPRDGDKDAMDALLGRRSPTQHLIIKNSVISGKIKFSEQDAYRRGIQEASEVSTVEEYGEIPEGEFGAAMLRGMGWKGEEFGSKPKEVKRRPHLMGLGSKEDEEIKKSELDKRNGHRDRRPRLDEYRRDREKEKQERNGRYRDSYKSERDRERREQSHEHRHRHRYHDDDDRSHR